LVDNSSGWPRSRPSKSADEAHASRIDVAAGGGPLAHDTLAIFQAGVDAVRADRLVMEAITVERDAIGIGDQSIDLRAVRRIVVVGAGKAGAGMSLGLLRALGPELITAKGLTGWVNVPADCVRELPPIQLHAARPAGINEPTEEGGYGAERILEMVRQCTADDLVFFLLSGGGSALLPAPCPGITLEEKRAVTRFLSAAGANIAELNTVRKQLSRVKGGRLARACRAGKLITLVISDVLGDPLDLIASGPTVLDDPSTPQEALRILDAYAARPQIPPAIYAELERRLLTIGETAFAAEGGSPASADDSRRSVAAAPPECSTYVIGNNAVAVDGAGVAAVQRGYSHAMWAATSLEVDAESVGRQLAEHAWRMTRDAQGPDCLITGGEPVVKLVPSDRRGKGGRNQQLLLAALIRILELAGDASGNPFDGLVMLSGGTDGEDGPTDAAGAYFDAAAYESLRQSRLEPREFLERNDAYTFFKALDRLIVTGPTHTNVCDLRVVVTRLKSARRSPG